MSRNSTFTIQDNRNSLTVEIPEKASKTFYYHVGKYEELEVWIEEISKIQDVKEQSVSATKEMEEKVIKMILGSAAWDWLWENTGHNVAALSGLLVKLSNDIGESMQEQQKGYV